MKICKIISAITNYFKNINASHMKNLLIHNSINKWSIGTKKRFYLQIKQTEIKNVWYYRTWGPVKFKTLLFHCQGTHRVPSPARELRSQMPWQDQKAKAVFDINLRPRRINLGIQSWHLNKLTEQLWRGQIGPTSWKTIWPFTSHLSENIEKGKMHHNIRSWIFITS